MRLLLATWDGAGNLPPAVGLIEGLSRRGHAVYALGHDTQHDALAAAGAEVLGYDTAPAFDHGAPRPKSFDFLSWFWAFNRAAEPDVLSAAARLKAEVLLIDCMLPDTLRGAQRAGHRTVALVHGAYSAHAAWRAPIDAADLALGFSYAQFDLGAAFPPNLAFVGPVRPALVGEPWKRRLPDRPLVVASQSSGLQGAEGAQADLLQRICDALYALEVEALVTTGRGIAPESLRAGANTAVARSVHHETVLDQAALFITHAGHGSIMAAVMAGTPMLCLPPGADQPHNAALVAALGLGEVLDPACDPMSLRAVVRRLLTDVDLKNRCRQFAADVGADAPNAERAVDLIEALAR